MNCIHLDVYQVRNLNSKGSLDDVLLHVDHEPVRTDDPIAVSPVGQNDDDCHVCLPRTQRSDEMNVRILEAFPARFAMSASLETEI